MNFKHLLLTGTIAFGMVACNNAETATEEHTHDHEAMEENANAEALYVPEGARVFFTDLKDGDTVTSPLLVQFGIEGMQVVPAGELVKGTGHHHLIIDADATEAGTVVPADETHIHFGGGQNETLLELSSGPHVLVMQFANGIHQSYGPQMAARISVYVK